MVKSLTRGFRWPKSLNIMGAVYRVQYVDSVRVEGDDALYWGLIEYGKHLITIRKTGGPEPMIEAIIHEIIHGLIEHNRLLCKNIVDGQNNEAFIKSLATSLADTLIRNGLIVPAKMES